jgi:hypothetical protein
VLSDAETTATVTCETTRTSGTIYVFVSTSATAPSAATLKAGTGATYASSKSVTSTSESFSVTGLSANTIYYQHWIHTYNGRDSGIVSSTILTAAAAPGVGDHDITLLPLDGNGWHDLLSMVQASGKYDDARIMYVSEADGNNGTAQNYTKFSVALGGNGSNVAGNPFAPSGAVAPYATAAAAIAQMRVGKPDIVLFKSGETFETTQSISGLMTYASGRANDERAIIGVYGGSAQAIFKRDTNSSFCVFSNVATTCQHIIIRDLHLWGYLKDPDSPSFTGDAGDVTQEVIGFRMRTSLYSWLIEGCTFAYVRNEFDGYGSTPERTIQNVLMRRCVSFGSYEVPSSKANNYHTNRLINFVFEDCVSDYGGWNPDVAGAETKTIFSHNYYLADLHSGVELRECISTRAAANGVQMRAGGRIHNCFFADNPIVGFTGANCGYGTWTYNVVVGSSSKSDGSGGWGMMVKTGSPATEITVQNNLIINKQAGLEQSIISQAIYVDDNATTEHISGDISDNVVVNWLSNGGCLLLPDPNHVVSLTVTGNKFVNAGAGQVVITHSGAANSAKVAISGNTYYTDAATARFKINGANKTFAEWQAATGDNTSTFANPTFSNSSASIAGYMTSISGSGTTLADFMTRARQQCRSNWDADYTAAGINAYFRAAYDMAEPA